MYTCIKAWILFAGVFGSSMDIDTYDLPSRECEPITVQLCHGLGYNYTGRPNFLGHDSQMFSGQQLDTYEPLIKARCSELLTEFLCAAYIPMCSTKVEQLIGPCRPVCNKVKNECSPLLEKFGFNWPPALNCSSFQERNDETHMCIDFGVKPTTAQPTTSIASTTTVEPGPPIQATTESAYKEKCSYLKQPESYIYSNATNSCYMKCDANVAFHKEAKNFSEIWMAIWTALSLLLTIFTIITFLLDNVRFKYPERPIIFLSLCYALYAIGYLFRLASGREQVICDSDGTLTSGLDNTSCAAVFLLLYYFGTAAALWWVILSLTWLLSAGLRWSHEAIELYSSYFHVVAWGVAAIQSIAVIVMREIGVDELSGLCYVTSYHSSSLLGFSIAPLSGYLLLGTILLVTGFIVFFCQEKIPVQKDEMKIEALMIRIGIFSILYTVPSTCLIACLFYEYTNMESWYAQSNSAPSVEIFMLKVFSSLMPGFTSGLCLLGTRTLEIWASVCGRRLNRKLAKKKTQTYAVAYNNNNSTINRHYTAVKTNSAAPSTLSKQSHYSSRPQPQGQRLYNSPATSLIYSDSMHV